MERRLLVLDDEKEIGRLFERYFRSRFDEVHVCQTVADALAVLQSTQITHVVVDHYLGPDEPLGSDVLTRWREQFPHIRYAALFTGSQVSGPTSLPGVDDVFYKPTGFQDLVHKVQAIP